MPGGRLLAARGHDLKHCLDAHLLVLDVLAQRAAQDLRDFLVGELDRTVQRIDLAAVRSGMRPGADNPARLARRLWVERPSRTRGYA
jgi:hypothetical protein